MQATNYGIMKCLRQDLQGSKIVGGRTKNTRKGLKTSDIKLRNGVIT